MDNRIYISVLTPAASSGSLGFSLQTFDASVNTVLSLSVTGITTSDTEKEIATKIYDQTRIQIEQHGANWQGIPLGVVDTPAAQFYLTRTDHCVCMFSQSQFELTLETDTTGGVYSIRGNPVLGTISNFRKYGLAMGQDYSSKTNAQLQAQMEILSDEIIAETRNPFVRGMYVLDIYTDLIDGVRLPKYPVVDMEDPQVRKAFMLVYFSPDFVSDLTDYYTITPDGWVMYNNSQDLVHTNSDPFDYGNQWRVSWVAGYARIPDAVMLAMVKLVPSLISSSSPFEQLSGGTSSVKYKDWNKEKSVIFNSLKGFNI